MQGSSQDIERRKESERAMRHPGAPGDDRGRWLGLILLVGVLAGACGNEAEPGSSGLMAGAAPIATGGSGSTPTGSGGGGAGTGGLLSGGAGGTATGGTAAGLGGAALGGGGAATGGSPPMGGLGGGGLSGGTSSGGVATGGALTGGGGAMGGSATGGVSSGGVATGGVPTGGTETGGTETGGTETGGTETGGAETGGAETGGAETGGAETGGTATGGTDPGTGGSSELPAVTVYLAGDSTVSTYTDTASTTDQAGWGQMLPEILDDRVTVVNRAAGGRTALWFHLEGAAAWILDRLEPGDYFLVQFGTNDGNKTATFTVDDVTYPRYAEPSTDFKTHLKDYYLDPTRAAGAIPVLVTAPPRNSAYCGVGNSLGSYAQAMRELGTAEAVTVLELNEKTFSHLSAICPAPTPEDFFFLRADGTVDGTHFQEHGARTMAGFLGDGMIETDLGLAAYLRP